MKRAGKRTRLPRPWKDLEVCARDHRQRSVAAGKKLHQVITGDILHHAPAAFYYFAIGGNELYANAEIAHVAKGRFKRPSSARRQQSADGCMLQAGSVARHPLLMFPKLALHLGKWHTRLHR